VIRDSYACATGAHHECLYDRCPCPCHDDEDPEERQANCNDALEAEVARRKDQGP